jgi:phosphate transport system substrate-binding protein
MNIVKKIVLLRLAGVMLSFGCGAVLAAEAAAPAKTPAKKSAAAAPKAAAPKAAAKAPAQPPIVWRGDHVSARIVKDLAKQYEAGKLGKVEVQPFSTISGLDAVSAGSADVAGSARVANPDRTEEKGINFFPLGWDALVPITSSKNPVSSVTIKQLHDIYLGRLTDWKDLGGAPAEINLYAVAGPLDGVEYSTRELLFHHGDQDVSVPRVYVNTEKLEEAITIDPHGLGMSTLSGVAGNPAIKMLAVEGVYASTASVADGSYPLYTTLYFAARDDGRNKEAVQKFVSFVDSDSAKAVLRKHSIVPFGDAADLMGKQEARVAYVDQRLHANVLVLGDRPVAAPNATAASLTASAPSAVETQKAKAQAARINAEKAEKKVPGPSDATTGH